jgi:hypothetical protein
MRREYLEIQTSKLSTVSPARPAISAPDEALPRYWFGCRTSTAGPYNDLVSLALGQQRIGYTTILVSPVRWLFKEPKIGLHGRNHRLTSTVSILSCVCIVFVFERTPDTKIVPNGSDAGT